MTNQQSTKRRTCSPCKRRFIPVNTSHHFCSDRCRKRSKRQAEKQAVIAHQLAFIAWVTRQCVRAGTVQILTNVSLLELYAVWKLCRKANGFGSDEEQPKLPRFELSHIAPVTAPNIIGTLHPLNLVVAPAPYNRARYNSWDGESGRWIDSCAVIKHWAVDEQTPAKAVAKKIEEFCPEGFTELLAAHKLALTARDKMIKYLVKVGAGQTLKLQGLEYDELAELVKVNPATPQPATMLRHLRDLPSVPTDCDGVEINLDRLSLPALKALYLRLVKPAVWTLDRSRPFEVYELEAERLGITPVDHWAYVDHSTECWDSLHGMPFTLLFEPEAPTDYYLKF